ncbi:esterase/rhamnogalacturonan acetylesterase [Haloferula helveola]|uniref:Esterase/rhamnogalacturonan acetylesterase n=2 Tax=Haloferula helveola TaxID=490095 RepID=A0ABM7R9S5_9BACT|nr:esterase/rhamnogalacturonan acetylesterase [Haloferula helveola]
MMWVTLGILHADAPIKIGLIGDSTVAQQSGWGPAFAKCFADGVEVHNHAVNGATLDSLSKRLDKLLALKPDYVLIQFGHNDQKRYDTQAYSAKLKSYIERVQAAEVTPIVLSSVVRRTFDEDGQIVQGIAKTPKFTFNASLTEYAKAAGTTAKRMEVNFIDLHHISMEHHNRIGPEESHTYDFKEGDSTHFNAKGGKAIAALIVPELVAIVPELKAHLR